MVRIRVIAIGKDKDPWISQACSHFSKLISRWARIEWVLLPSPKLSASLSPGEIKKTESALLKKESGKGVIIALNDSGQRFDSESFAEFLQQLQSQGGSTLNFLIGGPYGLDASLLADADRVVSLSPLTFSHQLVRIVLAEQLYRGFSILHGSDYHK